MAYKTPRGPAGGIPPKTPLRPEDFVGAPSVPVATGSAGAAAPIIPPKKPMRPEDFIEDPTPIDKLTATTQNLVDNQETEAKEETKIQKQLRMDQEKEADSKFAQTLNISVTELKIRRKSLKEIKEQTKSLAELGKKIEETGADPKADKTYMAKDLELTNATNELAQKALSGNFLMVSQLETMKNGIDVLGKKISSEGGDPKKNEEYQRLIIEHQAKTNELLERHDPSSKDSNTLEAMKVQLEQNGQVATDSKEYNKLNFKIQKKALEDRLEKADSPAARKEIRAEQAALAAKQEGLLVKIAGGISWMKNNAKEKLKSAGKGVMAMLKGTLIAGALVALVAFLDSKYWKELKKWLIENGAPMLEGIFNTLKWVFGGIADIFSGKAFTDFAEKIKKGEILGAFGGLFSAFGALAVAVLGIVAFLAPGLLFKGLWKGLKLLKKSLFGAGKAATAQAAAMKTATANAAKTAAATAKATKVAAEKAAKKAAKIAAAPRKATEAATKKAAAAAAKAAATKAAAELAAKKAAEKATKKAAEQAAKKLAQATAARTAAAAQAAAAKTAKAAEKTAKKAAEKTAKVAKVAGKASEKAASAATKAVGKTAGAVAKGGGAAATAAKGAKGAGGALSKVGKGFAHLKKYPLLMKAAKKIPLLGPILSTVGVVSLLMGDASKEDKIKCIGGLLGGGLGSWGFGVVGATLGSLFPGPGTIIGGLLGSLVGWFGGEWAGEKLAGFLMGEEESEKALLQNQKAPTSKSTAKSKEPPKQPPEKKLNKFEIRRKKRQERTRAGKETRSKSQLKNMEEELQQSELFIKTGGKEGKDTVYNIGDDVKGEKEDLANKKAAIEKKKAEVAELESKSPAALAAKAEKEEGEKKAGLARRKQTRRDKETALIMAYDEASSARLKAKEARQKFRAESGIKRDDLGDLVFSDDKEKEQYKALVAEEKGHRIRSREIGVKYAQSKGMVIKRGSRRGEVTFESRRRAEEAMMTILRKAKRKAKSPVRVRALTAAAPKSPAGALTAAAPKSPAGALVATGPKSPAGALADDGATGGVIRTKFGNITKEQMESVNRKMAWIRDPKTGEAYGGVEGQDQAQANYAAGMYKEELIRFEAAKADYPKEIKSVAVPKAAGVGRALDRQRETKMASWRGRAGLVGINENRVETMNEAKLDKAVPAAAPPVIINNNKTSVDNSQKTQATTLIGASTKNGNTAGQLAAAK